MVTKMFEPIKVGSIEAANRFFMAPLTRCRATDKTFMPNDLMKEYYTQRASAGIIITEFTTVTEGAISFHTEPGIYNDDQARAWKDIVDAVHAKGGKIVLQIAHGGRAAHPLNNNGKIPVSASAIALTEHTCSANFNASGEKQNHVVPHELTDEEAQDIIKDFVAAAKRAIEIAGFDGVEVHGANGYLIDQFLGESSNKRTSGRYAGTSLETRAQYLKDVLEAVVKEVGKDKVGLRISPLNSYQEMNRFGIENATAEVKYVANICNELDIAYMHVMRADFYGVQSGDVVTPARETFKNTLIVNIGYEIEEAETGVKEGKFDAVAFGTKFLANPDLPARAKAGVELNAPKPDFFYTKEAEGYTDYPTMA